MILILDVETTGLPKKELPKTHNDQPHILQAAWLVFGRDGNLRAHVDTFVNPGQQSLDLKVESINKIDMDTVTAYGVAPIGMLHMLKAHLDLCRYIVGYNVKFDVGMVERDTLAIGQDVRWLRRPRLVHIDLMQVAADRGVAGDGKWVRLRDAYTEAFPKVELPLPEHRADVDAVLAAQLFWQYVKEGSIKLW